MRQKTDSWLISFLDVLFMLVIILLAIVHPKKTSEESRPPGTISVEIRWPDNCDSDVDLWVRAPDDLAVGYSRMSAKIFNLLRDDLGNTNDLGGLNYENAYTRGVVNGEYIVNLHLYNHRGSCNLPIHVDVNVYMRQNNSNNGLFSGRVKLVSVGQEITVVRLTIKDNMLIGTNSLPASLRVEPGGATP